MGRVKTNQPRILVVEDDRDILDLITFALEKDGYLVTGCPDGERGLRLALDNPPNMVLLDLMLPSMDGMEICRRLRADERTAKVPVIMVTAKGEETDVVLGLGMGADDYVVKPFKPKELLARIKANLRRQTRQGAEEVKPVVQASGLIIDSNRHKIFVDSRDVYFTATEFRLLHFLASNPGRVFTRDKLMDKVIADGAIVIDRNIDVHIRSIRKKIEPYQDVVETVRGVGYRFKE